jgi:hypothetical protein
MFRNATMKSGAVAALFVTAMALSGCGTTPGDRAVSGGLLGAGGGAAIGSLYGDAGKGAVIGGVGGAALGALTTPPPPRQVFVLLRPLRRVAPLLRQFV